MKVYLNWPEFKTKVTTKANLRYVDNTAYYGLSYSDLAGTFESSILKDGTQAEDQTDFETNFKSLANQPMTAPSDSDFSPITRLKMAPTGWTYQLRCMEFETSVLGSVIDGVDLSHINLKLFDSSNNQIFDQATADTDCVKTVIDLEPPYNYEIIGGTVKFKLDVTENVRLSVVAVPDIPAAYGGSKRMVSSANLAFVDPGNGIQADGRVSKFMTYDPNLHTNKLCFIIQHPAGFKLQLAVFLEHYLG